MPVEILIPNIKILPPPQYISFSFNEEKKNFRVVGCDILLADCISTQEEADYITRFMKSAAFMPFVMEALNKVANTKLLNSEYSNTYKLAAAIEKEVTKTGVVI